MVCQLSLRSVVLVFVLASFCTELLGRTDVTGGVSGQGAVWCPTEKMMALARVICVVLVLVINWRLAIGDTVVSIRFDRYENPGGKGDNGNCCDGMGFICNGQCDHYFEICLDLPTSTSRSMEECPLGTLTTDSVRERNAITFGGSIGSTSNPVTFDIPGAWPGGVLFKIDVYDADSRNDNDLVENLKKLMYYEADGSINEVQPINRKTSQAARTALTLSISAVCTDGWYGPQCEVPCEEGLHHNCDPRTGQVVCHTGWMGSNCTQDVDECETHPCLNGSTCLNEEGSFRCQCLPGHAGPLCDRAAESCAESPCHSTATCLDSSAPDIPYICECAPGYTGWLCDVPLLPCDEEPCGNGGTCIDAGSSYLCDCIEGFTGDECETDINECLSNPCGTNQECWDVIGSYMCSCVMGWTGTDCDVNIDDCVRNGCAEGSTCIDGVNEYTCACPSGITGLYCDVSKCDQFCHNGGTCMDGEQGAGCVCTADYEGHDCTEYRRCREQPCLNNGTCATNLSPENWCDCPQGFAGHQCEEALPCIDGNCTSSCTETPCRNQGVCYADGNCLCPWSSYGTRCEHRLPNCRSLRQGDDLPALLCQHAEHEAMKSVCWSIDYRNNGINDKTLQCFVDEPCWCNNGGECHSDGLGVSCVCLPGFQGRYCDDIAEDNTSPYHTPETRDLPPYTTSRTGDSSQQRTPESRDASTYNPPEDPSPQNTPTHGKGAGHVSILFDTWLPGDEIQAFVLAIHSSSSKVLDLPRKNISVYHQQYICSNKQPSYTALEIDIFAGDRTLGTDDTRPVLEDVRDSVQADKTYTDSDVFHIGNLDHDHCELTGLIRASLSRGDGRSHPNLNLLYMVVGIAVIAFLVIIIGVVYWRYKTKSSYVVKRRLTKKEAEKRLSQRPMLYDVESMGNRYSTVSYNNGDRTSQIAS